MAARKPRKTTVVVAKSQKRNPYARFPKYAPKPPPRALRTWSFKDSEKVFKEAIAHHLQKAHKFSRKQALTAARFIIVQEKESLKPMIVGHQQKEQEIRDAERIKASHNKTATKHLGSSHTRRRVSRRGARQEYRARAYAHGLNP